MQTKPRPKRPNGTIINLSKALGVSKRHTAALLAGGMPDTLEAALAWRKQREAGGCSVEALRLERIMLVQEQREKLAIENSVRRNELITRAEVFESAFQSYSRARDALVKWTHDLPPALVGLEAPAIAKILRCEITKILTDLSEENKKSGHLDPDTPVFE